MSTSAYTASSTSGVYVRFRPLLKHEENDLPADGIPLDPAPKADSNILPIAELCNTISSTKHRIHVSFTEFYNGRVYDLLDNRNEVFLRVDANGDMHFRGAAILNTNTGAVHVRQVKAVHVSTAQDIENLINNGFKLRAAGISSQNDTSSRSHAVIKLEILSEELVKARERTAELEAILTPIGKRRDDKKVFKSEPELLNIFYKITPQGQYVENEDPAHADVIAKYKAELAQLEAEYAEMEARVNTSLAEEARLLKSDATGRLGGTLILIDLAGADWEDNGTGSATSSTRGNNTQQMIRESREINKSLLALKECIRACRDKSLKKKPPFRDSPITRVLQTYLERHANVALLAMVAPGRKTIKQTLNTLSYAQMVL